MKEGIAFRSCSGIVGLFVLALLFFSIQVSFAQPVVKTPKILEGTKPNFYKMQRKAEKYFKKHPVNINARMEEDTTGELEVDFGKDYNRKEDNEYTRYKRWEWFWRDRVNEDGSFPDAMGIYETYQQLQSSGSNFRLEEANPTWTDVSMKRNSGGY